MLEEVPTLWVREISEREIEPPLLDYTRQIVYVNLHDERYMKGVYDESYKRELIYQTISLRNREESRQIFK